MPRNAFCTRSDRPAASLFLASSSLALALASSRCLCIARRARAPDLGPLAGERAWPAARSKKSDSGPSCSSSRALALYRASASSSSSSNNSRSDPALPLLALEPRLGRRMPAAVAAAAASNEPLLLRDPRRARSDALIANTLGIGSLTGGRARFVYPRCLPPPTPAPGAYPESKPSAPVGTAGGLKPSAAPTTPTTSSGDTGWDEGHYVGVSTSRLGSASGLCRTLRCCSVALVPLARRRSQPGGALSVSPALLPASS